jgi:hypothetical protein
VEQQHANILKCTYSVVQTAGVFIYDVRVENTSPAPFSVNGILFEYQFNEPWVPSLLKDIAPISAPFGWIAVPTTPGIEWESTFQGSAVASGYILPGQTGNFLFQSSTPPPKTVPFGCNFATNLTSGDDFNGTAHLVDPRPVGPVVSVPPPIFNPWWWIETRGGLVPPGPPPPWTQELFIAVRLAGDAGRASPQIRARLLGLALEQMQIAAATMERELESLKK